MALRVQTRDIYAIMNGQHPDFLNGLDKDHVHWCYNGLDSAVTLRVHSKLKPLVEASPHASTSYRFVRAMQGPAMAMMNRGIHVQQQVRQDETARYQNIRAKAQALLDILADAVWGPETYAIRTKTRECYTPLGKRGQPLAPRTRTVVCDTIAQRPRGLNPNSPTQVLAFFNGALKCEVVYEIRKTAAGTERTPTANDKALRKWAERRTKGPGVDPRDRSVAPVKIASPFVSLILAIRDADKMLAVLRTPLDSDGRMRCSYNVVGTENGRWSSSKNAFGRGTNLQNITPSMRRMFCADDGHRLVSTDLEQAESRLVAGLVWQSTGDDGYWQACLSGDLHTQVCIMAWPELGWTSDDKENRKIAERPCADILSYSYRDVAKRLGHGSNYRGSPFGISQAVGIPAKIVEDFQARYFRAFPAIPKWHEWTQTHLRTHQYLDTPLGRRRWFFGRPAEDSTLREAIAFVPQSTVGELLNLIMYRVWERSLLPPTHPNHLPIQLLLQNHDAFAFQCRETSSLAWIIEEVNYEFQRTMIPLSRGEERRTLNIPGEFVTGYNWAYRDTSPDQANWTFEDGNCDGLVKFKGEDNRVRKQRASSTPGDWLSRPLARTF